MLKKWIESNGFEKFIVLVIALNAVALGLETVPGLSSQWQSLLVQLDRLFLGIFAVEIIAKLIVYRLHFFRDPWRNFDFLVVAVSLVPASGPFSVVRALRVLRTLRMVSVVPSLRKVVQGLLVAIPGLGAVASIMSLIFYVGAVMATKLFGQVHPEWFGDLAKSSYTLFQIMTLESWSMGIVRPVMENFPYAWLFFLPFILVTTFTMLNLFIAVIVNAMHAETDDAAEERAQKGQDERTVMTDEIRLLRKQIEVLHVKIDQVAVNVHTQ